MTGKEETISKAEALKRAKEDCKLQKTSNAVQHLIEGKANEVSVLSQAELPELPTIHIKSCQSCRFTIPDGTKVVKVLFEGCKDCTVELNGCTVSTGTVEVWRCTKCALTIDCHIGTLQTDVCEDLVVTYSKVSNMGMVVQAGMKQLVLRFLDGSIEDYHTGLEELRAGQAGSDGANLNDSTDQCITRFVDGRLLTERIIRLANDYPTTSREKEIFDAEARKKAAAIEGLLKDVIKLNGAPLEGEEAERLKALAKEAEQQFEAQAGKADDCSDAARALHRKNQGNEAFKIGDFQQAAVSYTESILLNDKDPAVFSNRAACFLKLGQAAKALADAERCVALDPAFVKGHFRRGIALIALERFEEGGLAMARTLELDPRNTEARASLQMAQVKAARWRAQS